jgi:hypothetical protein
VLAASCSPVALGKTSTACGFLLCGALQAHGRTVIAESCSAEEPPESSLRAVDAEATTTQNPADATVITTTGSSANYTSVTILRLHGSPRTRVSGPKVCSHCNSTEPIKQCNGTCKLPEVHKCFAADCDLSRALSALAQQAEQL